MIVKLRALIFLGMVCLLGGAGQGIGQERALANAPVTAGRIALLIGNVTYRQDVAAGREPFKKLVNPCNDVQQIAAALERDGWNADTEIIQVCDATSEEMEVAAIRFKNAYFRSGAATFGFIYYSGHGIQLGKEMYLFGIDASVEPDVDIRNYLSHPDGSILSGGVRVYGDILAKINSSGVGSIFVVIDACRNTPLDNIIARKPDIAAQIYAAQRYQRPIRGIKILYSTSYGEKASDGVSGGSPFSLRFVDEMRSTGRVNDLVDNVVSSVIDSTKNSGLPQIPDTTGTLNPPPPMACLIGCEG